MKHYCKEKDMYCEFCGEDGECYSYTEDIQFCFYENCVYDEEGEYDEEYEEYYCDVNGIEDKNKYIASDILNTIKRGYTTQKVLDSIRRIVADYPEAVEQFGVNLQCYMTLENDYVGLYYMGIDTTGVSKANYLAFDVQFLPMIDKSTPTLLVDEDEKILQSLLRGECRLPIVNNISRTDFTEIAKELSNLMKEWLFGLGIENATPSVQSLDDDIITYDEPMDIATVTFKVDTKLDIYNGVEAIHRVMDDDDEFFIQIIVESFLDWLITPNAEQCEVIYDNDGFFRIVKESPENRGNIVVNKHDRSDLLSLISSHLDMSKEQIIQMIKDGEPEGDITKLDKRLLAVVYTFARYIFYTEFYENQE